MHVYLVERKSSGVQNWLQMGCREKRQCMVGPCAAITMARDLHNQRKLQQKFLRAAMKVWATHSQASFL